MSHDSPHLEMFLVPYTLLEYIRTSNSSDDSSTALADLPCGEGFLLKTK